MRNFFCVSRTDAVAPVRVNSLMPYGRINSMKASIFFQDALPLDR